MVDLYLLLFIVCCGFVAFFVAKRKAVLQRETTYSHSLPQYYGYMVAIYCVIPALFLLFVWLVLEDKIIASFVLSQFEQYQTLSKLDVDVLIYDIVSSIRNNVFSTNVPSEVIATYANYLQFNLWFKIVAVFGVVVLSFLLSYRLVLPQIKARNKVERYFVYVLIASASLAILITVGIFFSVLIESIQFFSKISIVDFLFGLDWSPQLAIREDQVASSGAFGAIPIFWGTLFISFLALVIAVPIGLLSAIFLAEYANRTLRAWVKPFLEILAGIPTVVYGFFAALTMGPIFRDFGYQLREFGHFLDIAWLANLPVSTESAIAVGVVLGMMIVPFILSLSDDVLLAVPNTLREGAMAMGSTQFEMIVKVIIPAALPGIVGGVLLAISRAIGETMIVVMAAGVAANLSLNPFESATTVTVQIVTLLTGDQAFDSAKTLAAFALGLGLFLVTLCLNVIALRVVRKYREQYE